MKWFFLLLVFSGVVNAKTYKCEIGGKKSYQMHPCSAESTGGQVDVSNKQPYVSQQEVQRRRKYDAAMDAHFRKEGIKRQIVDEQLFNRRQKARYAQQSARIDEARGRMKREIGVSLGMTESQVERSLGQPYVKNKGAYSDSYLKEQWVYRRKNSRSRYIYFENGVVTSIQWASE